MPSHPQRVDLAVADVTAVAEVASEDEVAIVTADAVEIVAVAAIGIADHETTVDHVKNADLVMIEDLEKRHPVLQS